MIFYYLTLFLYFCRISMDYEELLVEDVAKLEESKENITWKTGRFD